MADKGERATRRKPREIEKVFEKYSRKLLRFVVVFVVNKLNEIYYNFR